MLRYSGSLGLSRISVSIGASSESLMPSSAYTRSSASTAVGEGAVWTAARSITTASRYFPALSSSSPLMTSGRSSCCARSSGVAMLATSARDATLHTKRPGLGIRRTVQPREVIENGAALAGGRRPHLLPCRRAVTHRGTRIDVPAGAERCISFRRRRFALAVVVALLLLERSAGIEESAEELLLPRDRGCIEPAVVQRLG